MLVDKAGITFPESNTHKNLVYRKSGIGLLIVKFARKISPTILAKLKQAFLKILGPGVIPRNPYQKGQGVDGGGQEG